MFNRFTDRRRPAHVRFARTISARTAATFAAATLTTGLVSVPFAGPASAAPNPAPVPTTPSTYTTKRLPTPQIDGVVWAQAVVGNVVYVGGKFTTARPDGAAAGVNTVPRSNILAYDVTTGALIDSFDLNANAQVNALSVSPDGKRLYIGGDFTQLGGGTYNRIAALDTTTRQLIPSFHPSVPSTVKTVFATDTKVYIGGTFSAVNNVARGRLAALNAADGALLDWAPVIDGAIASLQGTPDGTRVVLGGGFARINGQSYPGMGAVDAVTGATTSWQIASVIKNAGDSTGITSLSTDGTLIYGSAYRYGNQGGNFEGIFAADPANGGKTVWVADCHGDSYSTYPAGGEVYLASHEHYCGNIGAFGEDTPARGATRLSALTKVATSTNMPNTQEKSYYADFGGQPAPSMTMWNPLINAGTFTGQSQGAWNVAGNADYIVAGGEFTTVNGVPQQGLARFPARKDGEKSDRPMYGGDRWVPTATQTGNGRVAVSWQANRDRDDTTLTYKLVRNGDTANPIYTTTQNSAWWARPTMGFLDTGLTAGQTYTYTVYAYDPSGNVVFSKDASVIVAATSPTSLYSAAVQESLPQTYLRMSDTTDTQKVTTFTPGSSMRAGATAGATGDGNTAATFDGRTTTQGYLQYNGTSTQGPTNFTIETWARTTSLWGGEVISFGSSVPGNQSTQSDRAIYFDGRRGITFGVKPNDQLTAISSSRTGLNDGKFHHIVASLGDNGMELYVDGVKVASNPNVQQARRMSGWWRIGGDVMSGWPNSPSPYSFNGAIDDLSIYNRQLSAAEITKHYQAGLGKAAANVAPTASFSAAATDLTAEVDASASRDSDGSITKYAWDFGDGATGTGAKASHTYAAAGTYTVKLTVTDDQGATTSTTKQVTTTAPANKAPVAAFTASTSKLTATLDSSTSTDADGTVASAAWDFGDGATGTGAKATHTYAAAGTYTVKLTVTDDKGATSSTSKQVTVSLDPQVIAADTFARTATGGWGSAETGGAYTVSGNAGSYSVAGGAGSMNLTTAGTTRTSYLTAASSDASTTQADLAYSKDSTGGVTIGWLMGRHVDGAGDYGAKVRRRTDGAVELSVGSMIAGTEKLLQTMTIPNAGFTAGVPFTVKVEVTGTSPTTVRAKLWKAGTSEPADWMVTGSDSTAALQAAGSVGVYGYLAASATNAPVVMTVDNLTAKG